MADIKLKCYNAVRAEMFGHEMTGVDHVILSRSSPQTHTEVQFSVRYKCISFSATKQDHCDCARFKMIDYSHPYFWDTTLIPMTNAEEDAGWAEACRLADMPIEWLDNTAVADGGIYYGLNALRYDLVGLLSRTTGFNIIKPDPNNVWCSEADNMVFIAAKKLWKDFLESIPQPIELFPHELYMLAEYYFEWYQKSPEVICNIEGSKE